jgi:hypothetical protein
MATAVSFGALTLKRSSFCNLGIDFQTKAEHNYLKIQER